MAASTSPPPLRENEDPTTAQGRERTIRRSTTMGGQIALGYAGVGQKRTNAGNDGRVFVFESMG